MVSGFEHGQLVLQSDGTWHEWGGETNGFAYPTFSTHARRVMRFDADGVLSPLLQLKKIASEARELLQLVASACDTFFYYRFSTLGLAVLEQKSRKWNRTRIPFSFRLSTA